jgi:hypothetical protein
MRVVSVVAGKPKLTFPVNLIDPSHRTNLGQRACHIFTYKDRLNIRGEAVGYKSPSRVHIFQAKSRPTCGALGSFRCRLIDCLSSVHIIAFSLWPHTTSSASTLLSVFRFLDFGGADVEATGWSTGC